MTWAGNRIERAFTSVIQAEARTDEFDPQSLYTATVGDVIRENKDGAYLKPEYVDKEMTMLARTPEQPESEPGFDMVPG